MVMGAEGLNIFLSGPMTGYEHYNARGFVDAQIALKEAGAEHVYSPIVQWLCEPDRISVARTHESYMLECVQELSRMREDGSPFYDALVQIDGWQASKGARVEDVVAEACGIQRIPLSAFVDSKDDAGVAPKAVGCPVDRKAHDARNEEDFVIEDLRELWAEWFRAGLTWETVDGDGNIKRTEMRMENRMHPVAVAELLAAQRECERSGIKAGDIRGARITEVGSTGLNAFVNRVTCDISVDGGGSRCLMFVMSGPAIRDRRKRMSDEVEVTDLAWRQ